MKDSTAAEFAKIWGEKEEDVVKVEPWTHEDEMEEDKALEEPEVAEEVKPKRTYTRKLKVKVKSALELAKEDFDNVPYLQADDWERETYMTCPQCGWSGHIHSGEDTKCHICYNKAYVHIQRVKAGLDG